MDTVVLFPLLLFLFSLPRCVSLLLFHHLFRLTTSLFFVSSGPFLRLFPLLPLLLRVSNAADIRPGSRPFYVNHVVKDPTPPLNLEEDRRTCRASSKGRRRGTTLKRTTALIAGEIRVPRTRCRGVYFEYRFLFRSFSCYSSFPFVLLLPFSFFSVPGSSLRLFRSPGSAPLALLPPRWYWYCGRNAREHVRNPEWRPFIDKLHRSGQKPPLEDLWKLDINVASVAFLTSRTITEFWHCKIATVYA